ncbi:MAG: hypothetical protein ACLQF2_06285 [Rhodomicrobium sp.]
MSRREKRGKNTVHCRAAAEAILFGALIAIAGIPVQPAAAEPSYCPNPAHARPEKVPADLAASVASAFHIDAASARDAAFVRCAGRKLLACYTGANLVCDKAGTRRTLQGATAWCQEHPGSKGIPMAATGHRTIYDWSCKGRRAVAGKAVMTVDPQGYIAENWQEIR